jgi:hypothetical protein
MILPSRQAENKAHPKAKIARGQPLKLAIFRISRSKKLIVALVDGIMLKVWGEGFSERFRRKQYRRLRGTSVSPAANDQHRTWSESRGHGSTAS